MSEILSRLLEEGELSCLTDNVRSKLERDFRSKESLVDTLKADVERSKTDYEQKCYEIDKKMIEMSAQLDSETSNCAKATDRCKELENAMKTAREKSDALEMNFAESQGEIAALKHTRDLWTKEKLSMQHLIEKRDLEVNELKSEWKSLSDKLTIVTVSKNEIELNLDELQNSGVSVQYHNKRLEREKELLVQENKQLSEELKAKSSELNSFKLIKENELVSLRGRFEVKMDECRQLGVVNGNLRTTNEELEKKIDESLEKSNTAGEECRSMEELYRNELQSQTNLAELYKASANDEAEKSQELASAVQELQNLVMQSVESQKAAETRIEEAEKRVIETNRETELLKKELEKANDLLVAQKIQEPENLSEEDLAALCPTAAMASKFIKSGMTLTELYSKYVDALDEAEVAKQENKRLNDAMDAILADLNEKAPILKQQRDDYERALATITQLTSQMDAAVIECQHLRAEADDVGRRLGQVEREKKRLKMVTGDLSTQVRYLLKELEESRGHNVSMHRSMEADTNVTSSSEFISGHLVTFKSIEELQAQNKRLLEVVRELGEESEKKETENQSDALKQLNDDLGSAKEELEGLRQDRARQMEFVEAIVRQRDMYRVLLSQEPKSGIPLSIIGSPTQRTPANKGVPYSAEKQDQRSSESSAKALTVLKVEFDEYKKEVKGNNTIMNEQTESLRLQITELRADNAKLEANVNFSAEKYNVIKQSFTNTEKEAAMYREKNSKLQVLNQKYEMNLNNVSNELSLAKQENGRFQAKIENLKSELEILRRMEERVTSENSSLQRDQRGQSVLLTNLQKIQQTMEKQEFEVRSELRNRIESQERELKSLRRSTNDTVQQKQVILQMTEKQLLTEHKNLEQQRTENEALSAELRKLKSEVETSQVENQSNVSKVTALEQRLSRLAGDKVGRHGGIGEVSEDVVANLKEENEKCTALEAEVASLKLKLGRAQRAVQQHKEFSAAAEESLKQANEANRELSEALEARLRNASEHQTKLELRITALEDENRQLNSNKTSLISEVDHRTADLNKQMASLQNELDMVLKREKELRNSEQEARSQFSEQTDLIHDAQSKYQREMLLHAESVKDLMELKEKCKKNMTELENAKTEALQAKHLLDSNKGMWERQKAKFEQENEEMKERNADMNKQLVALHTQLETMSNEMVSLQQTQIMSPAAKYSRFANQHGVATESAQDPKDKSDEQLMDIIRFLRKEKNLCEVKYEVAQSESNRLKQQILHLQKQADEAKKALHNERQNSQATSSELSKHEALMKKVETLNVLSDSNRMLRDEKDRLQTELQTTKQALVEMKQKFSPIQAENNQFATQTAILKSEKVILEQDLQRWQQRSQQLVQSPRRQDPEEYRKLVNEKQRLARNIDQLNKEITDKKLEVSNLQGDIRNLNHQTEILKNENSTISKKVETLEAEVKSKQTEVEEKNKTVAQIRRVGRRFKIQFEELQKKQQEIDANQEKAASEAPSQEENSEKHAAMAEQAAKISALEASLSKTGKEKEEMQRQLETKSAENEALKSQLQHFNQKREEDSKVSSSDVVEENQKLISERDEIKKLLQEKDEKSKRLLLLAKNRIEQIRKEKDEAACERDRLRSEEQTLRNEVEKLKQDNKVENDQKMELHAKIEELQKQLSSAASHQQNKPTNIVHHHLPGPSGSVEVRKAANIRPISTQRVSQVSPMRVTRTARVMPEPQQEAQEGSSTDSLPARSSPHIPSSSHHSSTMSVSTSTTMPTRAFVHPVNPTLGRPQLVVNSTPATSSAPIQVPTRSDIPATQVEQVAVHGNTSSSTDAALQEATSSSLLETSPTDTSENDQAIVSSSDDQPAQSEDGPQQSISPSTVQNSSMTTATESEASPSQSDVATPASSIPVLIGRQIQPSNKRTYDETHESTSITDDMPASSSDAQVSVAPLFKRQRNSPDQSSAAIHPSTSQSVAGGQPNASQTQHPASSMAQNEVKSSSERGADTPAMSDKEEARNVKDENRVGTSTCSTFTPISEAEVPGSSESQFVPTSSGAGEVIVVLSDDDDDDDDEETMEQEQDEIYGVGQEENVIYPELEEGEIEEEEDVSVQVPTSSARPVLVLHPTPPVFVRNRHPIRPAPLTPGIVPQAADDGDGIVPCTPTLPNRRNDLDYQTINSPNVLASGPPIRFRFEDVAVPAPSFQSQSGIGSVDNTIMDFSDEARSVSAAPMPIASITTVTHTILEPPQMSQQEVPSVSSSIADEEEDPGEKDGGGEMCVPISSSLPEETGADNAPSEVQNTVSNLQNIRGRRIRLIGGRSKGKGGTSPFNPTQ